MSNDGPAVPPDTLDLEPDQMRRLGYRVVDLLVDRIAGLDADRAWNGATRAELEPRLAEPPPAGTRDFDALLDRLTRDVLPYAGRIDHPRFFAFIPSCPTWPGILGDFIAAGYNVFQGTWLESAGPSMLELAVLDWFRQWVGYPAEAGGLLLSGGSVANLTALACAREAHPAGRSPHARLYFSSETHSSIRRGARVLGFAAEQLRILPADEHGRLDPGALEAAVAEDVRAGLAPFVVVANAGATSTGAVDPLRGLAAVCAEHGLWLHADAAYGGFAVLTGRGRALLGGLELADSLALDPHKWLFQPYEAGCVLVRRGRLLHDAFHTTADYLQDVAVATGEINFGDHGIQLTRAARVFKIWLSLQYFGVDAFRAAIDRAIDLALHAQHIIETTPQLELLSPATLGVVCFRRRLPAAADAPDAEADLERSNAALVQRLARSGLGMVSSTRVAGRYAVRLCVMNHRSRAEDVERVLRWLAEEPLPA